MLYFAEHGREERRQRRKIREQKASEEQIHEEGTKAEEELSEEEQQKIMAQLDKCTLRDLSAPNVEQQPLCITYPAMAGNFKLKSGLIHLLPFFLGV